MNQRHVMLSYLFNKKRVGKESADSIVIAIYSRTIAFRKEIVSKDSSRREKEREKTITNLC